MTNPINHSKRKILFACVPADGHFNPLTGMAKYLQSMGYDVRWYTSAVYAEKLQKLSIPHYPFQKAMEVSGDSIDEVFPERRAITSQVKKLNFDLEHFFIRRAPEYLEDIQQIHETFPFDLMIADCLFMAIPFVKEVMKVPVFSIGIVPLIESSKDLAPTGLGMTPLDSTIGRLKQSLLRFVSNNILFAKPNKIMHALLADYGIDAKGIFSLDIMIRKSTLHLQSGTPSFEYYRSDLSSNIRFIGPLLPYAAGSSKTLWFDERLNRYKKIVLVTQGTVEKDVTKIIIPTLEAFKGSDTLVVCTTGGAQTPVLRKQFPESNIIIEDFIPFHDIMPYADVYITNGGYGGVMMGIENILPMVVAGVHEGKNEIGARIGYFQYGINLQTERPGVDQIRAAVTKVLTNRVYRQNIACLAMEFSQYRVHELTLQYVREALGQTAKEDIPVLSAAAVY